MNVYAHVHNFHENSIKESSLLHFIVHVLGKMEIERKGLGLLAVLILQCIVVYAHGEFNRKGNYLKNINKKLIIRIWKI